jgi:hypothetical protein
LGQALVDDLLVPRPVIEDMEFTYLDSSRASAEEPIPLSGIAAAHAAEEISEQLGIIEREAWGADETLRKDEEGEVIWPVTYEEPKVFIVHHTAGTDGGDDPAATIRAIYYWHAVVLGWGDIGYNYVIDPDGNIYHGRKGGDGVVGGHTFNTTDDVNFNTGSVGIALLGCFEDTPGACYTESSISPALEKSLAQLIGVKSAEFGFAPASETTFLERDISRVIGHGDVDYTYCPGSALEADLPVVRKKAQKKYVKETTEPFEAQFDSEQTLVVDAASSAKVTVRYTNTGTRTWEKKKLFLKIYSRLGITPTSLRHASWPDVLGKIQMKEKTVAPGGQATFTFSVNTADAASTKTIRTNLFANTTKVKKSNADVTVYFSSPSPSGL